MTSTFELILVVISVSAATATVIFLVQDLRRPLPDEPDMKMVREFIAQNVPGRRRNTAGPEPDRVDATAPVKDDTSRPLLHPMSAIRKTELVVSIIAGTRTVQEISDEHKIAVSLLGRWVSQAEDALVRVFLEDRSAAGCSASGTAPDKE